MAFAQQVDILDFQLVALFEAGLLIMIYLLGGPPRVGKSKISGEIRLQHALSVVSTDSLCAILENVLSSKAQPDLFVFTRFNEMSVADRIKIMMENTAEVIDYTIKEGRAVWKAVKPFIKKEQDEGRDLLIEGVAVLPELVCQLGETDRRIVFVGNQGKDLKQNIKKGAEDNEHDWMRSASDQYIGAFATFVVRMSAHIEQEAHKHGFKYIELDSTPFGCVVDTIVESLELMIT